MTTQISGTTGLSRNALPFLVGQVIFTAGAAAPSGFLKCNGAEVSRSTYAALFAVCGTTFGVGNGSTTFNLPDLRGEFIRGWDDGRTFGSAQAADIAPHGHVINTWSVYGTPTTGGGVASASGGSGGSYTDKSTNASTGTETRPRNIALLACIFTGI